MSDKIPSCVYLKNELSVCENNYFDLNNNKQTKIKKLFEDDLKNNKTRFKVSNYENSDEVYYSLEEIFHVLLQNVKDKAEQKIKKKITYATITTPIYFGYFERQIIRNTFKRLNLELIGVIDEPISACISYALKNDIKNENFLLVDLSETKLKISNVNLKNMEFSLIKSEIDSNFFKIEYFKEKLVSYFIELYKKKTMNNIEKDSKKLLILKNEVEIALERFQNEQEIQIEITNSDVTRLLLSIKLDDYLNLIKDDLRQMINMIKSKALEADKIIITGKFSKLLDLKQKLFNAFNIQTVYMDNLDSLVIGNALVFNTNYKIKITNRAPYSIGYSRSDSSKKFTSIFTVNQMTSLNKKLELILKNDLTLRFYTNSKAFKNNEILFFEILNQADSYVSRYLTKEFEVKLEFETDSNGEFLVKKDFNYKYYKLKYKKNLLFVLMIDFLFMLEDFIVEHSFYFKIFLFFMSIYSLYKMIEYYKFIESERIRKEEERKAAEDRRKKRDEERKKREEKDRAKIEAQKREDNLINSKIEEIKKLRSENADDDKYFIKEIFINFPPKNGLSYNYNDIENLNMRKLMISYHPDKNSQYGHVWYKTCEEITIQFLKLMRNN